MFKKLPVYEALITDETDGMFAISLVDYPAVESNFVYFDEDREPVKFQVQDEEQRLVRGVVMECGKLIYRRNESDDFEYYLTFSQETIRKMAQKYLKDGLQNAVDTQHNGHMEDGVEMVQWFISDKDNGVNPAGFEDIADHSLFAEFKVENDEIWNEIKEGTFKGFSLAGYFGYQEIDFKKQPNVLEEIASLLDKIKNKIN